MYWSSRDGLHSSALRQHSGLNTCCGLALPFEPYSARTADEQIEVAENGSAAIFLVEELVHEEMHRRAERI